MKNIIITLIVFGLVSCAMEEDTRLICNCDFRFIAGGEFECKFGLDGKDNVLIFNESKKRFDWNGRAIKDKSPEAFVKFGKDVIDYSFDSENIAKKISFDRVSLRFQEQIIDWSAISLDTSIHHYQCRVVEGV